MPAGDRPPAAKAGAAPWGCRAGGGAAGGDKGKIRVNMLRMAEQKVETAWVSDRLTEQLTTTRNCRSPNFLL